MKRFESSKIVLAIAIGVWLTGVIFGIVIVSITEGHPQLGELFTYMGAPSTTAFGFYFWKAKCENVIKYNKKQIEKIKDTLGGDNDASI